MTEKEKIILFVNKIKTAAHLIAFTGAGISVESGIPPFRGEKGIWNKYDPKVLDIDFFYSQPHDSWPVIREIFYDFFGKAKPNNAHLVLGKLQQADYLKSIITQNIDNLHQEGGATVVREFHGNSKYIICTKCDCRVHVSEADLSNLPLKCEQCGALMKPDFIFFGEGIPQDAYQKSFTDARNADVVVVIGSTGEFMPAGIVPYEAKKNNAFIIEINTEPTNFTNSITDLFIEGKAGDVLLQVSKTLGL